MFKFTVHVDAHCNRVPAPPYVCEEGYADAIVSPISLEWESNAYERSEEFPVQFPLTAGAGGKWFSWRGSKEFPLLVHDPRGTGQITHARQLFGNFTFGKNWHNGFDALRSLDADGSGKIDGAELGTLSLWFDADRDGVSDPGEVQSVLRHGVTALFFGPIQDNGGGDDLVLSVGFERQRDGRTETGRSIDWFARSYAELPDAAMDMDTRAQEKISRNRRFDSLQSAVLSYDSKQKKEPSAARSVAGSWDWQVVEGSTGAGKPLELLHSDPVGVLNFRDTGHKALIGYSLLERESVDGGVREISGYLLVGEKGVDENGRTFIEYQLEAVPGQVTRSRAVLSEDGKTLEGTSTVYLASRIGSDGLSYRWIGRRVGS
jgi:hypothetical protein